MTELTPRLELIRALLDRIDGPADTNLGEILAALQAIQVEAAAIAAGMAELTQDIPGEVGPAYANVFEQISARTNSILLAVQNANTRLSNIQNALLTANGQLGGTLPLEQAQPLSFIWMAEHVRLLLGNSSEALSLQYSIADSLANMAAELSLLRAAYNTGNAAVLARLAQLVDCGCPGGDPGDPGFPEGACEGFPYRLGLVGPKKVLGTVGSGQEVLFAYSIDITNAPINFQVAFVQDAAFDFTWFSNVRSDGDRQACIALSEAARALPGVWELREDLQPIDVPPINLAGASTISLSGAMASGSQLVTLREIEPDRGEQYFYCITYRDPNNLEEPPNVPGAWVSFGGLG